MVGLHSPQGWVPQSRDPFVVHRANLPTWSWSANNAPRAHRVSGNSSSSVAVGVVSCVYKKRSVAVKQQGGGLVDSHILEHFGGWLRSQAGQVLQPGLLRLASRQIGSE